MPQSLDEDAFEIEMTVVQQIAHRSCGYTTRALTPLAVATVDSCASDTRLWRVRFSRYYNGVSKRPILKHGSTRLGILLHQSHGESLAVQLHIGGRAATVLVTAG